MPEPMPQIEDVIAGLPCWGGPITVSPLAGGITNRNFRVDDPGRGSFAVRFGSDIPVHGIMRFNELAAARAAYGAGLSPEVVHAEDGILVSRFITGRVLTADDVRAPGMLPRLVEMVRRCHVDIPRLLRGPTLAFWVFQVNRSYIATLLDDGSWLIPDTYRLAALNNRLEALVGPVSIVFGHNDLLPANLIDDGHRLWLLDWDYAGFNSPLFDLANLSSNNGLSQQEDLDLLARYFGKTPDSDLMRRFTAMRCASLLREALWGAISESRSEIDFDYHAYTLDYLARLEQAMLHLS